MVFRSLGDMMYWLSISSSASVSLSRTRYERRHTCMQAPRLAEWFIWWSER